MSEARPSKIETVLRRWPLIAVVLLILIAIVCAPPLIQKHRFIQRHDRGLGLVQCEPGWLREKLPHEVQDWLIEKTGIEWVRPFEAITVVPIQTNAKIPDKDWNVLSRSTQLKVLSLGNVGMTDADFNHLKGLHKLTSLSLGGNPDLTDSGLVHLKSMDRLSELVLSRTKVTDDGLVHLRELTNLEWLWLSATEVSDDGLAELRRLIQMKNLALDHTNISDAGLAHLAGMTELKELYIEGTKVTGEGLIHLKGIKHLQTLSLSVTEVTDASLIHLEGLKELESVSLFKTKTTPEGAAKLKAALPSCEIKDTNGNTL